VEEKYCSLLLLIKLNKYNICIAEWSAARMQHDAVNTRDTSKNGHPFLVRKLTSWTYSRKRQSTLMYQMMIQAQPVTIKRRTTIYLPNKHRKAPLKMMTMNSQMRKIHLSLERKVLRKSKLHFLIGCIQLGCDSLLPDSYI
jgi:hypothetical protein